MDPSEFVTVLEPPAESVYSILVDKSEHRLTVYLYGFEQKSYPCNLRNELPDRLLENDGQTPEGIFTIYQMAVIADPPWSRWMAFDTLEKAKVIYAREHADGKEVLAAYEAVNGPIQDDGDIREFNRSHPGKELLRGFGIHGGGYFPGRDWTLGCPALSDEDAIELYETLLKNPDGGIGTKVYIQD